MYIMSDEAPFGFITQFLKIPLHFSSKVIDPPECGLVLSDVRHLHMHDVTCVCIITSSLQRATADHQQWLITAEYAKTNLLFVCPEIDDILSKVKEFRPIKFECLAFMVVV
jgi:hypothetical protein